MIYYLLTKEIWLRSIFACLFSFIFIISTGKFFIKKIKKIMPQGQPIRIDGPETHQIKSGTPNLGGILIIISLMLNLLLFMKFLNHYILMIYLLLITLFFLGLIDDIIKTIKQSSNAINAKTKMLVQILITSIILYYLYSITIDKDIFYTLQIPYLKNLHIKIGILIYLLGFFVITGTSNAVNLTDGLDGLIAVPIIICSATLIIITYIVSNYDTSLIHSVIFIENTEEIIVFLSALIGSMIGFYWFNSYPASIFIGDSGSLSIGGVLGLISIILKHEILFAIIGGIFLIEALSVIMQVVYFKITSGKRIFLMAPLHHHYEKQGVTEQKIVARFHIITLILNIIALISFII